MPRRNLTPYRQTVRAFIRYYLSEVMQRNGYVLARAARAAGVPRPEFYRYIEHYAPDLPRRANR